MQSFHPLGQILNKASTLNRIARNVHAGRAWMEIAAQLNALLHDRYHFKGVNKDCPLENDALNHLYRLKNQHNRVQECFLVHS